MFAKPIIRFRVLGPTGLALIVAMGLCPLSYGKDTFITKVLDFLGVSATSSAQRGPKAEFNGAIWVAELDTGTRFPLTEEGGYHSPVFMLGGEGILALKGDDLQFVPLSGGEPEKHATLPGVIKIVGSHQQDKDKLLILFKANSDISVGILSLKDGKVSSLPYDKEDKSTLNMLTHLSGWIRVYDNGNTTVEVKPDDVQQGKWTNVYSHLFGKNPRLQAGETSVLAHVKMSACSNIGLP